MFSEVEGTYIERLGDVEYRFNEPVRITGREKMTLVGGDETAVCTSMTVSEERPDVLTASFGNIPLENEKEYTIVLPGTVSLASDDNVINREFRFKVKGADGKYLKFAESVPANGDTGIFRSFSATFFLPAGMRLTHPDNPDSPFWTGFYKGSVSEENKIPFSPTGSAKANKIEWSLTNVEYEPETKYIVFSEPGTLIYRIYDGEGKYYSQYCNGEMMVEFFTPSVSGLSPLTFDTPTVGGTPYSANMETDTPGWIDLKMSGNGYEYNGVRYSIRLSQPGKDAVLYDITDGKEELCGTYMIWISSETMKVEVDRPLFEGHIYKLVIPAGSLGVAYTNIHKFVQNEEVILTFTGAAENALVFEPFTASEGDSCPELAFFAWTAAHPVEMTGTETKASVTRKTGTSVMRSTHSITLTDGIYVRVDLEDGLGRPMRLPKDTEFSIVIPEGTFCSCYDSSIVNTEISVSLKGADKEDPVAETVEVEMEVDGSVESKWRAAKGLPLSITLTPGEDWEVRSITRDGVDVTHHYSAGAYTTSPLKVDTRISVSLGYAGKWAVDESDGIYLIEGTEVRIFGSGGRMYWRGPRREARSRYSRSPGRKSAAY